VRSFPFQSCNLGLHQSCDLLGVSVPDKTDVAAGIPATVGGRVEEAFVVDQAPLGPVRTVGDIQVAAVRGRDDHVEIARLVLQINLPNLKWFLVRTRKNAKNVKKVFFFFFNFRS